VPQASLDTFPPEFCQGMVARAARLGDVGDSAPAHWIGGLAEPAQVHLIVTIHGRQPADVGPVSEQVLEAQGGRAFRLVPANPFDGQVLSGPDGSTRYVHFGYVDGISQPRFEGIHEHGQAVARQPFAPLGAALLGYPTALPHVSWRVPEPEALGHNGAFNAFRILRQDVRGFDAFLDQAAAQARRSGQPDADAELVAAKLCGRWRNGAPLTLAPDHDAANALDPARYNDFDYPFDDADGSRCPIGSHIRRSNPRGAQIVQRAANRTRPIVRRGMPYGPAYDPAKPDDTPRGLLGSFICASLAAQFEAIQYDWLNLGLQHPGITGTNDPLVGANSEATSRFVWPTPGGEPIVLQGLKRFVKTEGGSYCFLPSLPAIDWIASQGWKSAGY
jgi:deferrochelatase/peroxidase EfeB